MNNVQLHLGDCLEILPTLEGSSVDAIICDPPYGTTACKWDSVIPLEAMWAELKRVIKPRGAIVLFGSQPFTTVLIHSNLKMFRYSWVWEKTRPSGVINCKISPLKSHEDVVVFGTSMPQYTPQMTDAPLRVENEYTVKAHKTMCQSDRTRKFNNDGKAYPRTIVRFSNPNHNNVHPTQKPVPLLEYLVKTYAHEGQTVLDFTMGSGTTGVACVNTGRKFIGIERDQNYFNIASERIARAHQAPVQSSLLPC